MVTNNLESLCVQVALWMSNSHHEHQYLPLDIHTLPHTQVSDMSDSTSLTARAQQLELLSAAAMFPHSLILYTDMSTASNPQHHISAQHAHNKAISLY